MQTFSAEKKLSHKDYNCFEINSFNWSWKIIRHNDLRMRGCMARSYELETWQVWEITLQSPKDQKLFEIAHMHGIFVFQSISPLIVRKLGLAYLYRNYIRLQVASWRSTNLIDAIYCMNSNNPPVRSAARSNKRLMSFCGDHEFVANQSSGLQSLCASHCHKTSRRKGPNYGGKWRAGFCGAWQFDVRRIQGPTRDTCLNADQPTNDCHMTWRNNCWVYAHHVGSLCASGRLEKACDSIV